jgi:hypothetical protein
MAKVCGPAYSDLRGRTKRTEVDMTFIVTGLNLRGPTLIECDTAIGALEKAAELIRSGYAGVLIADFEGVLYTPCEFVRLFDL